MFGLTECMKCSQVGYCSELQTVEVNERPERFQLRGSRGRKGAAGNTEQGQVKSKGQGFWKHPLTHLAEHHTASVMLLGHRQDEHNQLDMFAELLMLVLQNRISYVDLCDKELVVLQGKLPFQTLCALQLLPMI